MIVVNKLLFFIVTYFLSGFIIATLLERFLRKPGKEISFAEIYIFGLGLGPVTISLILYLLFLLFPDKANLFYIFIIEVIFLLMLIIIRKNLLESAKKIFCFFTGIRWKIRSLEKDIIVMGFLVALILSYIFIQGIGFPIVSHDGCVYAYHGKYFYEIKNLDNYMAKPDEKTGAYLPLAHPPGLALVYTWFYLLQGNTDSDILPRTVAPMYGLYLVILLWIVLRKRKGKYCGIFGLLLLVLTPIFVWQSYENSIDPMRMFFIFSSFVMLGKLLQEESVNMALLIGLAAGFAMYTHVTGILALLVVIPIYLLFSKKNIGRRIRTAVFIGIIAMIIGGTQYAINYLRFNNILGTNSYSFFVPKVRNFYSSTELIRVGQEGSIEIKRIKLSKNLVFGRLQMFSRPELFGLSYYIFLFALFYWIRSIRKEKIDIVLLLAAILYAIPVIYKFYSNRRYIFTIQPLIVYFGGLALGEVYVKLKDKKLEKRLWILVGSLILITMIVYFAPASMASLKFLGNKRNSKITYLISNKKKQNNILCPGLFEAIEYINVQTPKASVVLTFSDARYFYYAKRKGIYWSDPRMKAFYSLNDKIEAYHYLLSAGINHIMVDILYEQDPRFKNSELKNIIEDKKISKLVFGRDTKVYQLKKI